MLCESREQQLQDWSSDRQEILQAFLQPAVQIPAERAYREQLLSNSVLDHLHEASSSGVHSIQLEAASLLRPRIARNQENKYRFGDRWPPPSTAQDSCSMDCQISRLFE